LKSKNKLISLLTSLSMEKIGFLCKNTSPE